MKQTTEFLQAALLGFELQRDYINEAMREVEAMLRPRKVRRVARKAKRTPRRAVARG